MTFNANYCWNSINFHLTLKNLLSCLVQRETKKFITQKQNFKETEIYFVLNGFFSEGRFDSIFPVWFFISECTKWCDCVCVWVCTDSLGITHVVKIHFVKNHFVKSHFVKSHFLKNHQRWTKAKLWITSMKTPLAFWLCNSGITYKP